MDEFESIEMKNNFFDYTTNVLMILAILYFIPIVLKSIYGSWDLFLNMKKESSISNNVRVMSSLEFNQQIQNFLKDPEVKIIVVKNDDNAD